MDSKPTHSPQDTLQPKSGISTGLDYDHTLEELKKPNRMSHYKCCDQPESHDRTWSLKRQAEHNLKSRESIARITARFKNK